MPQVIKLSNYLRICCDGHQRGSVGAWQAQAYWTDSHRSKSWRVFELQEPNWIRRLTVPSVVGMVGDRTIAQLTFFLASSRPSHQHLRRAAAQS